MELKIRRYLYILTIIVLSLNCASNMEIFMKRENGYGSAIKSIIGKQIYFLSLKEYGKVYSLLLDLDGSIKSDIDSLSGCKKWDVEDNLFNAYIDCGEKTISLFSHIEKGLGTGSVPEFYSKILKKDESILVHTLFGIKKGDGYGYDPHDLSLNIEKEGIFDKRGSAIYIVGEDSLRKFNELLQNNKLQNDIEEKKLLKDYPINKIIDLRIVKNSNDFFLIHFSTLADNDLYDSLTLDADDYEFTPSEYKNKFNELQSLKSKKYLIFEESISIRNSYDNKKGGFNLNIEDNYNGGFKRIYSPPIFIKMDVEKYKKIMNFNKVVCIAEYKAFSKNEKAYLSTKYDGILNEENYEKYKINFKEGLPYIVEKNIKLRKVELKVLNYRIFDSNTGNSYWKQ
jgi:hypothetical protein